jgi:hypothetical protein
MKRAIFRKHSIDVCVEGGILCTPISPETLPFAVGEEIVVATPKAEAPAEGEYQFLFTVGDYVGDRPDLGNELFRRPDWRHAYRVTAIAPIRPFSLDEVVAAAADGADEVHYRYKGQTQHHRIIRTILHEHEELWRSFIDLDSEPVTSAVAVVAANEADDRTRTARQMPRERLIKKLRTMDKQNASLSPGREYRAGKTQDRNRHFASLVRALYAGACQVCGLTLSSPDGSRLGAQVHHIEPWNGGHSDRLENVICVCRNHHAMFELGSLKWAGGQLHVWGDDAWQMQALAVDQHLTVPLPASAQAILA